MHYYQFNIADYRKDTAHLSMVEHYIYRQLIDWYYLDEKPIPKETQTVMRRLSLGSDDVELLQNVLNDFFIDRATGWNHERVNADIAAYKQKAAQNKENGKRGGRPKNQGVSVDGKPKETQPVISGNPSESESNPNQELLTNKLLTKDQDLLSSGDDRRDSIPYMDIIKSYNDSLPTLPYARDPKPHRKRLIKTRWNEDKERQDMEWWNRYFAHISRSPFLTGDSFSKGFDWFLNPTNMDKVIEGNFHGGGNQ